MGILQAFLSLSIGVAFFALLLSFYVTSEKGNTTRSGNSGTFGSSLVSNKTITLETDLKLNVNSDKYFVSGYPDVVKVKISGPSALVIAAKNTQNFETKNLYIL